MIYKICVSHYRNFWREKGINNREMQAARGLGLPWRLGSEEEKTNVNRVCNAYVMRRALCTSHVRAAILKAILLMLK